MGEMPRPADARGTLGGRGGGAGSNEADVGEALSSLIALCERVIAEKLRAGADAAALEDALAVLKTRLSAVVRLSGEGTDGEDATARSGTEL
ncbi:hypothetical protein [Azospirillum thermophilum]|uniref:Uncharacterized protein n=1 Tax=Azospirillum thermophilum TaxID=2202148 RepID=A0A2S2CNP8_9PROT|nr:hypothetical protein [Azospirillum thermophilum]AWK85947.1 hypothetical protein DEW08_06460 [Azospirillum thermophilum]